MISCAGLLNVLDLDRNRNLEKDKESRTGIHVLILPAILEDGNGKGNGSRNGYKTKSVKARALVDSGASHDFIARRVATQLGTQVTTGSRVTVKFADGRSLWTDLEVVTVCLHLGQRTRELRTFVVLEQLQYDVILGQPWLQEVEPIINWRQGHVSLPMETINCTQSPNQQFHDCGISIKPAVEVGSSECRTIVQEFSDVFPSELPLQLPPHRSYDHHIQLKSTEEPARRQVYRLSCTEKRSLKEEVDKLLKAGFLRPSKSPYGAPVFLIPKKQGGHRLVCDWRQLNELTIKNRTQLPRIDELIDELQQAKIFSQLDLHSGYHQIRMADVDIPKTAIVTPFGHFEWTVMGFGLTNAPATFQSAMTDILAPFIGKFVVIYLDDILIYSKSPAEHTEHLRAILEALRRHQFFAKPEKCRIGVNQVTFLGFVIKNGTVSTDPAKVEAIKKFERPRSITEARAFLGLANVVRDFIPNFADLTAPLTALTSPRTPFHWTAAAQKAFIMLKDEISRCSELYLPDLTMPFILQCDASNVALGAVLLQLDRPVAFFSRQLLPAERNYPVHDRELLAIVAALRNWRHYLVGRHFIIQSDHQPLQFLKSQRDLNSRQARWLSFLGDFDFSIDYIRGKTNKVADALSRCTSCAPVELILSRPTTVYSYDNDQFFGRIKRRVRAQLPSSFYIDDEDRLWLHAQSDAPRLCIPAGENKNRLIAEVHASEFVAHPGEARTIEQVKRRYFWPKMDVDIRQFVKECRICQKSKRTYQSKVRSGLHPLEVPEGRWTSIGMDFITDLPTSAVGHDAVLVIIDRFSRRVHLIPTKKALTTEELVVLFTREYVRLHGLPTSIVSDRDPRFTALFWKQLTERLGVKLKMSTAAHPQSDGVTERANRAINATMRALLNDFTNDWEKKLPLCEFAINSNVHAATGMCPFQVDLGYVPPTPFDHHTYQGASTPADQFILDQRTTLQRIRDRLTTQREQIINHQQYLNNDDSIMSTLQDGDLVLIDTHRLQIDSPVEKKKWRLQYEGPYRIISKVGQGAYRIKLPSWMRAHDVINEQYLKRFVNSTVPEPILAADGSPQYIVERILDTRQVGRNKEVLIQWRGYPLDEASWEPERSVITVDAQR